MEGDIIETWKYAIIAGIVVLNFVFTLLLIANNSPIKGKQAKIGAASIVLVASLLGLISIFVMKDISPAVEVSSSAKGDQTNPAIADGLKVVAKNKCTSCHVVNGEGTALGPDFDLIAKNSDLTSVEEFLGNPKLVRPGTAMQNVNLDEEEVKKIVAMFKAMRWDSGEEAAKADEGSDVGMKVFSSKCVSCHAYKGEGGNFGPDLTDVKSRRDEASITAFIKDPTGGMPKVELSEEELKGIVGMLSGAAASSDSASATTGKGLEIIKGKCQGCHSYQGAGGSMGPDLTDVKSRRDAANLTEFIKNPTGGMPPVGLPDDELKAVVEELSGAAGGGATSSEGTPTASGNAANGETILKAKCVSCHAFKGSGGSFGPDLTDVGKKKDAKSLAEFIKNPSGGMPQLGLPDAEIQDLVALFTGGNAPKQAAPSKNGGKANAKPSAGKNHAIAIKTFKEKCLSCHTVNGEGGKFGPELTDVAKRLDKKKIVDFIMNPSGGMPNMKIPVDEATKIAEYFIDLSTGGNKGTVQSNPSSPGITIYKQHACNACHMISGKGGTFGPDLTQVGLRRDQDSVAKFLNNPPSKMTITPLTKEEIDSLAGYLSTLK